MKRAYGQPKRFAKKTLELLTHIDEIVNSYMERGMSITVRQVYYQCVTKKFIKNSQEEYKKIVDRIRDGRLSGLLDWEAIEDRTRYQRGNVHWSSPSAIIRAATAQYKINTRATQPHYIECSQIPRYSRDTSYWFHLYQWQRHSNNLPELLLHRRDA